jgi:sugar phosphate isomerase/epimerase
MPSPILFSSAAFFARPLSDTFRLLADTGYTGVEVMVTKDPASQDPAQMRALAEAHGLRIGAIHAPCLLITRRVWGTDPSEKIARAIEVANDAAVPLVVVHPPYRWQGSARRWLSDAMPGLAAKAGVTVAVENMFPVHLAGKAMTFHSGQDLAALEGLDDLVLDTSHAAVTGHDLLELRSRLADRIRHVHLSDNAGKGWDSHLPLGDGVLPIDAFLHDLTASGYPGAITLEVDLRRHLTEADRLRSVMVSMREKLEQRLAREEPALG